MAQTQSRQLVPNPRSPVDKFPAGSGSGLAGGRSDRLITIDAPGREPARPSSAGKATPPGVGGPFPGPTPKLGSR